MSEKSNNLGRSYEYACIHALFDEISKEKEAKIVKNSSFEANERAWMSMEPEEQKRFRRSAEAAAFAIVDLEPLATEKADDVILLEFQSDEKGVSGDVRDILLKRDAISWEVGLSVKHNHKAVKHSRLSKNLDFGKNWFGIPCSQKYWKSVKPIFDYLTEQKQVGTKWSDLPHKEHQIYLPLLSAFIEEIKTSYQKDSLLP